MCVLVVCILLVYSKLIPIMAFLLPFSSLFKCFKERMILIWQIIVTQIYTSMVLKRSWQTSLKSSSDGRARMSVNRNLPLAAAGSASSLRAPASRPLISALALKKSSSTAKDSSLSSIYLQRRPAARFLGGAGA